MNGRLLVVLLLLLIGAGSAWALYETTPPIDSPTWDREVESGGELPKAVGETGKSERLPGTAEPGPATAAEAGEQRKIVDTRPGFLISGRVVDDQGQPVRSADVIASTSMQLDFGSLERVGDPGQFIRRLRDASGQSSRVSCTPDGRFQISPAQGEGKVQLTVRARGYLVAMKEVERPADADVDVGSLVLVTGAVIAGRVIDHGGRPVARALVRRTTKTGGLFEGLRLAGPDGLDEEEESTSGMFSLGGAGFSGFAGSSGAVRTDQDGRFEMPHERPGEFTLRVSHPDHPPASRTDQKILVGQSLTNLIIRLARGATIAGKLVEVPAGTEGLRVLARAQRPAVKDSDADPTGFAAIFGLGAGGLLDGIGLAAGDRTVTVDGDGKFVLRGLEAGLTYKVWAVQKGTDRLQMSPCADPTQVAAGTQDVVLTYSAGIFVTFQVVDARTKSPITKLRVKPRLAGGGGFASLMGAASIASASEEPADYPGGRVTLTQLRPKPKQHLLISIDALGFAPLEHRVDRLPKTGTLDLEIIQLKRVPIVRVQVSDAVTGEPVAFAKVELGLVHSQDVGELLRSRLELGVDLDIEGAMSEVLAARGTQRSAYTDEAGWCEINGYSSKSATITVTSGAHATHVSEPLKLPTDAEFVHKVALIVGGEVEVTVLDSRGRAVEGVGVSHRDASDTSDTETTNAEGLARFDHLVPGQHRFKLENKRADASVRIRFNFDSSAGRGGAKDEGWQSVVVVDRQTKRLSLIRSGSGNLTGIVRENGQPLRGARVTFVKGNGGGEVGAQDATSAQLEAMSERFQGLFGGATSGSNTDGDGIYSLQDIPVGEHRLKVTHPKRAMPQLVAVQVTEGDNTLNLELHVSIVSGRVIGSDGPIEGATISVALASTPAELGQAMAMAGAMFGMGATTGDARTDEDGRFELRGVRTDEAILIRAKASGYSGGVSEKLVIRAGGTLDGIELRLLAAGRIAIRITGEVVTMGAVRAEYLGAEAKAVAPIMKMITGRRASLSGLRPGRWKVMLSGLNGGKDLEQTVEVSAKKTTRVIFKR